MKKLALTLGAAAALILSVSVANAAGNNCTLSQGVNLAPKTEVMTSLTNAQYTTTHPIALEGCLYAVVATNAQGQNVKVFVDPISALILGTAPLS